MGGREGGEFFVEDPLSLEGGRREGGREEGKAGEQ